MTCTTRHWTTRTTLQLVQALRCERVRSRFLSHVVPVDVAISVRRVAHQSIVHDRVVQAWNIGHQTSADTLLRSWSSKHASSALLSMRAPHFGVLTQLRDTWSLSRSPRSHAHHVEVVRVNRRDVSAGRHGIKVVFAIVVIIIEPSGVGCGWRWSPAPHVVLLFPQRKLPLTKLVFALPHCEIPRGRVCRGSLGSVSGNFRHCSLGHTLIQHQMAKLFQFVAVHGLTTLLHVWWGAAWTVSIHRPGWVSIY